MRLKTLLSGLAIAALTLGVSMSAAAADENSDPATLDTQSDRYTRMEQRLDALRERADARADRLRKRAEAYRFLINPWAEMHHRALRAHNDAIQDFFDSRAAWDRAIFDQQRNWFDALADTQRAWIEREADWQFALADRQRDYMERVMDAQADWVLAHQPVPLVYGPGYFW
jgi:hypothetical protein